MWPFLSQFDVPIFALTEELFDTCMQSACSQLMRDAVFFSSSIVDSIFSCCHKDRWLMVTTRITKPNGLYVSIYDIIKINHQNYEIKQ